MVYREDPRSVQGLGLFFRYGFAHQEVNEIEHFWSIGGQYTGLVPGRDEDVLGFGVAQGLLTDDLRYVDEKPGRETVLELYYNILVAPGLTLSPDVQVILDPGGRYDGADSVVLGLRAQMCL